MNCDVPDNQRATLIHYFLVRRNNLQQPSIPPLLVAIAPIAAIALYRRQYLIDVNLLDHIGAAQFDKLAAA